MNLPAFCIHRPAFTIVISLVMTLIGIIGFTNLPVRWIPNVNPPQVTIQTTYPGANASLVERDVTKVIEGGLSGINGIEMLTSTSRQDESQINITFKIGRNMDAAVEDVRSNLERIRRGLPKDIQNPIVRKEDPNSDAVLIISLYDKTRNARELSDYIDKYIVPSLETIDGVGSVWVYGKRISAMRITLDPSKMAAMHVTVDEITQLLRDQNVSIPSGNIRGEDRFYSILTNTALNKAKQFDNLIIRSNQNQIVRLKDVGTAKLASENIDSAFRISGRPGIALGIIPQSTANPLDVEKRAQKAVNTLKRTLPAGMELNVIYNQADYIRASIQSVYESFIEAVIFVWIVILAFLCRFRATFIPIITIPVCLISTFALLYFLGFSINTVTLMAFVLAIGLVVDDAIVMLENISRHMEAGLSAQTAALKGSQEMIFPVIAMTVTLAAVYAPIAFTPGLLGVLFREFTFTLAGALLISGIVALTLSPMMCARLLDDHSSRPNRYSLWLARQLEKIQTYYRQLLVLVLHKRLWVVLTLLLVGGGGLFLYHFLPAELAPGEDMGQIYVSVAAPRSSSFTYMDNYAKELEAMYKDIPDIKTYLTISGSRSPSHAFQILILKDKNERKLKTQDLIKFITDKANTISGVKVNAFAPPPPLAEFAGSDEGDSLGLVMMTTNDYRQLQQEVASVMEVIKKDPQFIHVENKLKWDSEQFEVSIDREKAADLQVGVPQIANTISTLIGGKTLGKSNDANVIVQMNEKSLSDPNLFNLIYIRNTNSNMVPLSSVINIKESTTPQMFSHYDRLRSDTIFMTLGPQFKLADAIKTLQTIAKENIPADIKYSFTGEAKSFLDSNGKTLLTFTLALVFIYLVLTAQFESFIDPLIILLTVPFAMIGALLTLKIFGGSLNIYSNIGMITLVGLIAKHGILITDFANRLRMNGKSIQEAVIEASLLRLRPILMTTSAMVLGALPLAFAYGPGAESRQQIGLVITGGLICGTLFSLIVIPVTYTYLTRFRKLKTTLSPSEEDKQYANLL
jgi:multidrug efflux pump